MYSHYYNQNTACIIYILVTTLCLPSDTKELAPYVQILFLIFWFLGAGRGSHTSGVGTDDQEEGKISKPTKVVVENELLSTFLQGDEIHGNSD